MQRRWLGRPVLDLFLLSWLEYLEAAHERLIHTHHSTGIIELTTVCGHTAIIHRTTANKSATSNMRPAKYCMCCVCADVCMGAYSWERRRW